MSITRVEEIQVAIESLPYEEYIRLRQWFSERDWEKWDRQIETDSESGKLDFLIEEALTEKANRDGGQRVSERACAQYVSEGIGLHSERQDI